MAAQAPSITPVALTRSRVRTSGRKISQSWGNGLGPSFAVCIGITRGVKAKTNMCSVCASVINPHWDTCLFPVIDNETNNQREARLIALAVAGGGVYEDGVIHMTTRAKSTEDALNKAKTFFSALGIPVSAEAGRF